MTFWNLDVFQKEEGHVWMHKGKFFWKWKIQFTKLSQIYKHVINNEFRSFYRFLSSYVIFFSYLIRNWSNLDGGWIFFVWWVEADEFCQTIAKIEFLWIVVIANGHDRNPFSFNFAMILFFTNSNFRKYLNIRFKT